jgi:hypothetical protein
MIGCVYLHRRPDLRPRADGHSANIKDDAINIQKHVLPKSDIVPKVAMKRRPDNDAVSNLRKQLSKQHTTF